MASALFQIDTGGGYGTAGVAQDASASATINCRISDLSGIDPTQIEWSIFGTHDSAVTVPTIASSGVPSGQIITFSLPSGAGQAYGVQLKVNGGTGRPNGDTKTSAVYVLDANGRRPFFIGETYERDATHGVVEALNDISETVVLADGTVTGAPATWSGSAWSQGSHLVLGSGTTPSLGTIRWCGDDSIYGRNAADDHNCRLVAWNQSLQAINIGSTDYVDTIGLSVAASGTITCGEDGEVFLQLEDTGNVYRTLTGGDHTFQVQSTDVAVLDATQLELGVKLNLPEVAASAIGDVGMDSGGRPLVYVDSASTQLAATVGTDTAMRLVEYSTVAGSAVTSVTFSGLDGDFEGYYKLVGRMVNATATAVYLSLEPNSAAVSTNGRCAVNYYGASNSSLEVANDLRLCAVVPSSYSSFTAEFLSNRRIESVNSYRYLHASYASGSTTAIYCGEYQGVWQNTGNDLYSIRLTSSVASAIGPGSWFTLLKVMNV